MLKSFIAVCAMSLLWGCSWLGMGDDSSTTTMTQNETPVPVASESAAPAVSEQTVKTKSAKAVAQNTAKAVKGAKSEAQIKTELDQMGKKLAAQSGRTLLPNKAKPDYKKVGNQWVASFIDVDPNRVTTELRPGANGQYIGFIRYQEKFMECAGPTKEAALKGNCIVTKTRNLNELIRYDGKAWQD